MSGETAVPKYLVPRITPEAAEFFAGTVRGELRIQRCTTCGLHQHYPRLACSHCGAATIEWVTASRRGTVHSYTVIRQNGIPPFSEQVPFVVALVDLEEPGARLLGAMPTLDPTEARIGMAVRATFRPASEMVAFVDFEADPGMTDDGPALYLHEYVDIVGEGAMQYMQHTVDFDAQAAADRGLVLVGTFYTMGSTGRWPQVVNLWECVDRWAGWRRLMESTNLRRTENPALNAWWREALEVRTGGFDRLLAAGPGCPTRAELLESQVTGSVFVHELSKCRPGAGPDYLAAVRDLWAPVMADHGHTPVGWYEVLLTDTEVLTVWATDPAGHVALMSSDDTRVTAWATRRREFLTRWREELMTPHPASFLSRGDTL